MKDRAAITKELAEDPYERLANAIIVNAANDYRVVLKKFKRNPNDKLICREKEKIEKFFRSPWYRVLTTVDGEYLIEQLCDEAEV